MSLENDDQEPVPDWGPLTAEEETLEDEFSSTLREFDEDIDLDDEASPELDAGISLADGSEDEPEGPDFDVDLGTLVGGEDLASIITGEEFGPLDDDLGSGIRDMDSILGDDAEGTAAIADLLPGEVPAAVVQAGDDLDGALSEEVDELPFADEEDPPSHAERPWVEVPVGADREPCSLVRFATDGIFAGGKILSRVDENDAWHPLTNDLGHDIRSVVVDAGSGTIVISTANGELYRLGAPGSDIEGLSGWRSVAEIVRATKLRLGGPTPSARPALLLHVEDDSSLLESTDRGTTFRRVDLGGRVVALSTGTPPVCLVETKTGLRLFRGTPTGGFAAVGDASAFDTERVELASEGDVIAALEPSRGIHISGDGGATFRRVKGSARATALTTGRLGTRRSAFAALFESTTGRAALVWIDAVSADALVIADLSPTMDDDTDDDAAMIRSLAWDAETETLWAAGAFGLRRFRRPPSA